MGVYKNMPLRTARKPTATNPWVYFGEIEWADQDYSYDMTMVFLNTKTGALGYAEDSGCSCPSPFEDAEVKDLTIIKRPYAFQQYCEGQVKTRTREEWMGGVATSGIDQMRALIEKVTAHLTAKAKP